MVRITYGDLIALYGVDRAKQLLCTLEKASLTECKVVPMNREARLRNALDALNQVREACA